MIMNMKMESDTVFCMICIAAFIGYSLGFQHAVGVVGDAGVSMSTAIKAQENENKKMVHKFTQTNVSLSELGKILTANNLIHPDSPIYSPPHTERQLEVLINNNDNHDNHDVLGGVSSNARNNEQIHDDKSETTTTVENKDEKNKVITNSSEEEYEVIMGSVKKCDVKRGGNYKGWFDSLFF